MSNYIDVKAAGMFTPQTEGDCKLTIIISEEDKTSQNFAFTKLRYQPVRISLIPVEASDAPAELSHADGADMVRRGLEIMIAAEMAHNEPIPVTVIEPRLALEGEEHF